MAVKAKIEGPLVVTMPAGIYFIGDPVHAVRSDDDWNAMTDSSGVFEDSPVGTILNGDDVAAFTTAFGSGVYEDQFGNSYQVNSGFIGVVPLSGAHNVTELEKVGAIRTFTAPFQVASSYNGALTEVGDIEINTEDKIDFGVAEQYRGSLYYNPRAPENDGRDTRDHDTEGYDPRLALQEYYDVWASGAIGEIDEDVIADIMLHVGRLFGRK